WPNLEKPQLPFHKTELDVPGQGISLLRLDGRILAFDLSHHLTKLSDFVRLQQGVVTTDGQVHEAAIWPQHFSIGSPGLLQQSHTAIGLENQRFSHASITDG